MKRVLYWILMNTMFAIVVYFGCIKGIKGAENLVVFLSWLLFILSFSLFSKEMFEKMKEKGGRAVPKTIDVSYDIIIVTILVWNSFVVTGIVYSIHIIIYLWFYDEIDKSIERDKKEQTEE